MQFVIDENIPKELIDWLKTNNHIVSCVPKGSDDEKAAAITKEKDFVLLTLDRHFANTLRFPPKDFPGIIRIKLHPSYIEDIIFSLEKLFIAFPKKEHFKGKLILLEKYGFFKLKE